MKERGREREIERKGSVRGGERKTDRQNTNIPTTINIVHSMILTGIFQNIAIDQYDKSVYANIYH